MTCTWMPWRCSRNRRRNWVAIAVGNGLRMRVRHYAFVTGFHQPLHHVRAHSSQAYHSELHSFPPQTVVGWVEEYSRLPC